MQLKYDIQPQNLKVLEIKQITLDRDKFGALVFEKAYPLLHEMRKIVVELEELGYRETLATEEINAIDGVRNDLLRYVKQIYDLNPATDASFNKVVRDNLELNIQKYFNNAIQKIRPGLVFLRQEASLKSQDVKDFQEQSATAVQAGIEYKKLSEELRKELDNLKQQKQQVAETKGEVAAMSFGKSFESQSDFYDSEAVKWMNLRQKFFWALVVVLVINALLYIILFTTFKLDIKPKLNPKDFFTIEYGLVKLAILSLLSYGLGFCSRNYNINAGLAVTNRHRKNVAETITNFLASGQYKELQAEIIGEGTNAMFRHLPIGYIKKENNKDDGPVNEFIYKMNPFSKDN